MTRLDPTPVAPTLKNTSFAPASSRAIIVTENGLPPPGTKKRSSMESLALPVLLKVKKSASTACEGLRRMTCQTLPAALAENDVTSTKELSGDRAIRPGKLGGLVPTGIGTAVAVV